jgi:hypothetical protein
LLALAMPQPLAAPMPTIPAHDFDLATVPVAAVRDDTPVTAIDAEKEGIKGGQWDELPPTRWTYQAGEYGPAIQLGTGGGKLLPLRNDRPKTRDGKLAHLVVGWDF